MFNKPQGLFSKKKKKKNPKDLGVIIFLSSYSNPQAGGFH